MKLFELYYEWMKGCLLIFSPLVISNVTLSLLINNENKFSFCTIKYCEASNSIEQIQPGRFFFVGCITKIFRLWTHLLLRGSILSF